MQHDSRIKIAGSIGRSQASAYYVGVRPSVRGEKMTKCRYCGDEIEFRYVDGRPTPIHLSGGWCQGSGGSASSNFQRVSSFKDVCTPTKCPKCGEAVFLIRHNGGSVWVDDLGCPWPKHACFDSEAVPTWFSYFKRQTYSPESGTILLGVVIGASWVAEDDRGPSRIILAVDGGASGRVCIATTGTNTPDYLLGRIAIVDLKSKQLTTSNHEVRPILRVLVQPEDLGLSSNWATVNIHGA